MVVKRSGPTITECRSNNEALSSPEGSYARIATQGIPAEDEGKIYTPHNKRKLARAAKRRQEETQRWLTPLPSERQRHQNEVAKEEAQDRIRKWLPGGIRKNGRWMPIPEKEGEMSLMEATFNRSKQYTWIREMPGWCYMALIKSEYRYGYHWPAYPTIAQLAALPHAFRDTLEGAQIVMSGLGTYHVMLDMNCKKPWKTIKAMANGALSWTTVGASSEASTSKAADDWYKNLLANIQELRDKNDELEKQVHTLTTANEGLQTQVTALSFSAPAPAPAWPAAAAPAPRPLARDPDAFDGTMEKTEGFLTDCQLYLGIRGADYPTELARINWVLNHMTNGTAAVWRENIVHTIRQHMDNPRTHEHPCATPATATTPRIAPTVAVLFARIRAEFGDMNQQSTRINKLRTITQGDRHCDEHVQNFKQAALGSSYNDVALVEEFKRSLNTPIRRKLMESENPPLTLTAWYERAITVDRNWRQYKAEEALYQKREGKKTGEPAKDQKKGPFNKWKTVSTGGGSRPPANPSSFTPRTTPTFTPRANTNDNMEVDRT